MILRSTYTILTQGECSRFLFNRIVRVFASNVVDRGYGSRLVQKQTIIFVFVPLTRGIT